MYATAKMFETFGADFDVQVKLWKQEVESGVKKEKELVASIVKMEEEDTNLDTVRKAVKELEEHQTQMHPGYSFTGDNVDMRVLPRQMTIKNKAKDHHMFQICAFKNRISPNHLPDDKPNRDINKEPFTTFLPSAEEQLQLVEEFVILVGNKWADYIPALAWYADPDLPMHIHHENMDQTKKKTEKGTLVLFVLSYFWYILLVKLFSFCLTKLLNLKKMLFPISQLFISPSSNWQVLKVDFYFCHAFFENQKQWVEITQCIAPGDLTLFSIFRVYNNVHSIIFSF
jgi:hypothetical protein